MPIAAPKRGRNLAKSLIKALGTLRQSHKSRPFLFQFRGLEHDHKRSVRKEVQAHLGAKMHWSLCPLVTGDHHQHQISHRAHLSGTGPVISSPPFSLDSPSTPVLLPPLVTAMVVFYSCLMTQDLPMFTPGFLMVITCKRLVEFRWQIHPFPTRVENSKRVSTLASPAEDETWIQVCNI